MNAEEKLHIILMWAKEADTRSREALWKHYAEDQVEVLLDFLDNVISLIDNEIDDAAENPRWEKL